MRYSFFILVLLLFAACKRTPISTLPTEKAKEITKNEVKTEPTAHVDKDFRYLKATCKADWKDSKNNVGFTINLRVRKDSLIWLHFTKMGISGARVLITPDSVRIINYLEDSYTVAKFDTLEKILNFRLNFSMLQAVLFADMPIPEYEAAAAQAESGMLKITQERDGIAITNVVNEITKKLHQLDLKDLKTNNVLSLLYQNFQTHGDNSFAHNNFATITFRNKTTREIEISEMKMVYKDVKFSYHSLELPFDIPKKYKRK